MRINLAVFALAAFFEIVGCFAFWLWVRRGATPFVLVLGVASLVGFAFALTRVDSGFAGRAYAAYGGIYIVASLIWLWVVEGQSPTRTDFLGAALAITGAVIIIGFAARPRWMSCRITLGWTVSETVPVSSKIGRGLTSLGRFAERAVMARLYWKCP